MALTSIANIVESITNPSVGQGTDSQQGAQAAGTANSSAPAALIQDSFTPSNQTNSPQAAAQEAGLFQVSQLALFAATASSLASQTTQPQANQNPAPAQVAQVATTIASVAPTVTTNNFNGLTTATTQVSAAEAVQTAPVAKPPAQIPAFNQALTALGLTNNDIQRLDQIATLVNVFSPTAFNDLIGQFQALAQQAAQLSAVNISGSSPANSGGYQVQGLSIQFSSSQQSSNAGIAQGGRQGGGTQTAQPSLQLGGVQITLTNAAGQSAKVQVQQRKPGTPAAS
jgi:hypothetical protein